MERPLFFANTDGPLAVASKTRSQPPGHLSLARPPHMGLTASVSERFRRFVAQESTKVLDGDWCWVSLGVLVAAVPPGRCEDSQRHSLASSGRPLRNISLGRDHGAPSKAVRTAVNMALRQANRWFLIHLKQDYRLLSSRKQISNRSGQWTKRKAKMSPT